MMLKAIPIVLSSLIVLSGCQSTGGLAGSTPLVSSLSQHSSYPHSPTLPRKLPWTSDARIQLDDDSEETPPEDLWARIRSELSWDDVDNKQVQLAVDQYVAQPSYLPDVSERGSLYLYYIVEEVQKRNMPMEIALIPLVESTLDPFAYSPGQAAGRVTASYVRAPGPPCSRRAAGSRTTTCRSPPSWWVDATCGSTCRGRLRRRAAPAA